MRKLNDPGRPLDLPPSASSQDKSGARLTPCGNLRTPVERPTYPIRLPHHPDRTSVLGREEAEEGWSDARYGSLSNRITPFHCLLGVVAERQISGLLPERGW